MITSGMAQQYLDRAADNVRREYPHHASHVVRAGGDFEEHRVLHPAFFGAYDWHSSVHQHWLIARLLGEATLELDSEGARQVLAEHLTGPNLAAEAAYLREHRTFERPYGWAWAARLWAELSVADFPGADEMAAAVAGLVEVIRGALPGWLETLTYPVRHGLHSNTSFALLLFHECAEATDDADLRDLVARHARRLYEADVDAPTRYEPSGEDFLSPVLCELDLMSRVMERGEFAGWAERFLPEAPGGEADLGNLATVPTVTDPTDYRIGHLVGLMLSRAWNAWSIADRIEDGHPLAPRLRRLAAEHVEAGLPMVLTSGYGGDHWLATFAVLAADTSPDWPGGVFRPR